METGHELFVYGLQAMLDGERQLVGALGNLAGASTNPDLKDAFESHHKETEGHVSRLEECFQLLGEQAQPAECQGIRGLIAEKKAFAEQNPSPRILDVFDITAAIKTENYEICAYRSLIELAHAMKHTKVQRLLNQSLQEERKALRKMEELNKKIKPEEMMTGEQAAAGQDRSSKRVA